MIFPSSLIFVLSLLTSVILTFCTQKHSVRTDARIVLGALFIPSLTHGPNSEFETKFPTEGSHY